MQIRNVMSHAASMEALLGLKQDLSNLALSGVAQRVANVLKMPERLGAMGVLQRPDPELTSQTARYGELDGELFSEAGPSEADVVQGNLGNCYFMAALASIVASDPDAIRNMIRDNGNGTYSVRFFVADGGNFIPSG